MTAGQKPDRDEGVALPLDPEEALRALLAVRPEDEPVEQDESDSNAPSSEPHR